MRRSLRNNHRIIWLSFVIVLPLILAIAWNVRPLTSGGNEQRAREDNPGALHDWVIVAETDIAKYKSEDTPAALKLLIELRSVVRVPQLAVYVSHFPIRSESMSSIEPSAFFDGEDHLLLTIPKAIFRDSVFVLLADNVKRQHVDQVKLTIK